MKHLIAATVIAAATWLALPTTATAAETEIRAPASCPSFQGKYLSTNEDSEIELDFQQTDCASAFARYDYGSGGYVNERTMTFDGVKHRLPTDDSYLWLEAYSWNGKEIKIEGEYRSKLSGSVVYTRGRIYLDQRLNLREETVFFDKDWKETQRMTYFYFRKP